MKNTGRKKNPELSLKENICKSRNYATNSYYPPEICFNFVISWRIQGVFNIIIFIFI